jgi:GTP-binding protein HflX
MQAQSVETILADLGMELDPVLAGEGLAVPLIEAWNKWDVLDEETRDRLIATAPRDRTVCPMSALTGEGVSELLRAASQALVIGHRVHDVTLPRHDGQRIAWLHQHGEVLDSREQGDDLALSVRLSDKDWGRFQAL